MCMVDGGGGFGSPWGNAAAGQINCAPSLRQEAGTLYSPDTICSFGGHSCRREEYIVVKLPTP